MFKKIIVVIFILSICAGIFFGYSYVTKNMHVFASRFLEENLSAKISVGGVAITFPLCIELKDIDIEDSLHIRSAKLYPNLASFFSEKKVVVSTLKIIDPVIRITGDKKARFIIPDFLKDRKSHAGSNDSKLNFYFSKIRIKNGTVLYGKEGNILEVVDIKGVIENPIIFSSGKDMCRFAATGSLKNRDSDFLSPLSINGCVEHDATIKAKVHISDVRFPTFGRLYEKYMYRFIKDGKVDLESDIRISKKSLMAKCFLQGKDVVLRNAEEKKLDIPVVASFIVFANFKSSLLKIKNLEGNFLKAILGK